MSITITDLRDAGRIRTYIGEVRGRDGGRNPQVEARLAEAETLLARAESHATSAPTAGRRIMDLSLALHAAQSADLIVRNASAAAGPVIDGDSLLYPTLYQSWCMGVASKALRFFGWLRKRPVFGERPSFHHVAFLRSALATHWFWRLSMPRPLPPPPQATAPQPPAAEAAGETDPLPSSCGDVSEGDPGAHRERKRARACLSARDGAAESPETR